MTFWLVAAALALLLLIVVLGGAATAIALMRRGGGNTQEERAKGLQAFGYSEVSPSTWVRPIQGTTLTFAESPERYRWSLQLPRYNTMTLDITERAHGTEPAAAFPAGNAELDARFFFASLQPAPVAILLAQGKLQRALLRMPHLHLQLSADELVLAAPRARATEGLDGSPLDAELALHHLVGQVINALFAVLYTEDGTVFDQFR